jgi:hypothetical protein
LRLVLAIAISAEWLGEYFNTGNWAEEAYSVLTGYARDDLGDDVGTYAECPGESGGRQSVTYALENH